MFKRSRRRIILAIMGSLILLFGVTLSVILLASYREIRQENMEMLQRHVELFYLEEETPPGPEGPTPGTPPEQPDMPGPPSGQPLDQRPGYRLSTFYSVAFGSDGTVLAVDNGEKAVYSREELTGLAQKVLSGGGGSGRTGSLSWMVSRRPDYTLVAFMDNTVSEQGLHTLLRNVLIIGGAAMGVLFLLSLILSGRIIRPLEENDRRQKQFISDASHELKTPVAVIGANAELLSRQIGENEWLANILYENERMGGLVRQLLELSRAENAEVPMEPVDFSRLVTGEVLALETLAFENGRTIRSGIGEGIQLSGSPTQLAQLVSILLDNAIRHATGSRIDISLRQQGHGAVLWVANDGEEIPPEKLAHLFDRFYRLDEARSGGQHYGLGLSIARAIVQRHGGTITAASGGGRVQFTVTLPIKK